MTDLSELPNPQRRAVDLVKEVAAEKSCHPYLVGGPVRDLLLGRQVIDIDLTLEEGSSTLARALAKRVEGRVRSFPQFLTYKVIADGLPEIDIATARTERYREPGALPSVSPGKLRDDLLRRDFSINALALDLGNGELHDPTGGGSDLQAGLIRILHEKSFLDDPTRIFRAIRLAGRLAFAIEPQTEALVAGAIEVGALASVSRERLWRELFLTMDEAAAPIILAELCRYGVLDLLLAAESGKPLRARCSDTDLASRLEPIKQQLLSNQQLDRYVLYTAMILEGSDPTPAQLEGSGFSPKRAKNTLLIAREIPRIERAVAGVHTDRQRFRLFRRVSAEMLGALAARQPEQQEHVTRFQEYRRFKLPLRGTDLEVPLGPHIAKALERAREAVFIGEIEPDQARTFAREMAMKYLNREKSLAEQ